MKIVCPAFKGCLAHVHRGMMWLCHTEMTELMHARAHAAAPYIGDATMLHVGHV